MVIRYDIAPEATAKAYWYRWRTGLAFKGGVLAAGLVPATMAFAFAATAMPRHRWLAAIIGIVTELVSPLLFAGLLRQLSRRGSRALLIDADGLTTEVRDGQWHVSWREVRRIARTEEFIFILGRGLNSVSIPVGAFADDAERDEFVRRAQGYLAGAGAR
jgi:hypothetical protein